MRVTLKHVSRGSQNVTLSLPTGLLQQVKILAVKRGTSLSGLLASQLKELVQQDESYRRAHRRHRARMKDLPDLGTRGRATWTREDLHER